MIEEKFGVPKISENPPELKEIRGENGDSEKEEFNPAEEVRSMLRLSRHERKEKLPEVQERLEQYINAHAKLQEQIIEEIRKNPDVEEGALDPLINQAIAEGGIPREERIFIQNAFGRYVAKHDAVERMRAMYPNDRELYQALFGARPDGRVEVITGPMTFYFRCFDDRDYARIHEEKFLKSAVIGEDDITEANKSGGVHLRSAPLAALEGTLIAENTAHNPEELWSRFTRVHEEQHAINQLLTHESNSNFPDEVFDPDVFDVCNRQKQELLLKRYLRWLRETAEEQAKDEILAYFKEGQYSFFEILTTLTEREDKGSVYDYLNSDERVSEIQSLIRIMGNQHERLIKRCVNEVFVSDYHALLKKSLDAIAVLSESCSKEQVIAILQRVPLNKWTKVKKRLVKEEWRQLMEEYTPEKEENDREKSDDYEKMPKQLGFGRSK